MEEDSSWEDYEEATVIHRIGIQGQGLKYRARGEVPGWVLNRFSMDENNGHFRIATTKGWSWGAGEDQSKNMVSVLDMALNETGVLEDIAPGEQIYSARFMGNRCYLVTFRQIDPCFVIDLHDAENPEILTFTSLGKCSSVYFFISFLNCIISEIALVFKKISILAFL